MERLSDVDGLEALMDAFASSRSERFDFREMLARIVLGRYSLDGVLSLPESGVRFSECFWLDKRMLCQPFVKELVFDGIALGDHGVINIISHLMDIQPTSGVESLSFVGCNMRKSGMFMITQFMKYIEARKIKLINFSNNPLGGTGALGLLGTALCKNSALHWGLNLSNIGLDFATDREAIATIVRASSGVLKLNLSNNAIDNAMFLDIISLLKGNTSLTELDLTGNDMIDVKMLQTVAANLQSNTTITKLYLPNICNADGVLIEALSSTADEVSLMQAAKEAIVKIIQRNLALAFKPATEEHKGSDTCSDALVKPIDAAMVLHDDRRVITSSAEPVLLSDSAHGLRRRGDSPSAGLLEHAPLEEAAVKSGNALMNCWHAVVERCCPRRRTSTRESC